MKHVRTRYVLAALAIADATLLLGGVPLQRYSWIAARDPAAAGGTQTLWMLLAANLGMLLVAFAAMYAAMLLSKRAWIFARGVVPMRYGLMFARSSLTRRTSRPR